MALRQRLDDLASNAVLGDGIVDDESVPSDEELARSVLAADSPLSSLDLRRRFAILALERLYVQKRIAILNLYPCHHVLIVADEDGAGAEILQVVARTQGEHGEADPRSSWMDQLSEQRERGGVRFTSLMRSPGQRNWLERRGAAAPALAPGPMDGKVLAALAFAATKHRDQRRKDARRTPYINHLIEVVDFLANKVGVVDPVTLMAAALHDTIEDTATTYQELVDTFGLETADVVMECTDDKKQDKVMRKKLQLEHAGTASYRAKTVKVGDKWSNNHDEPPANWSAAESRGYRIWSWAVCQQCRGVNLIADDVMDRLFAAKGIDAGALGRGDALQVELEAYYKLIDHSD